MNMRKVNKKVLRIGQTTKKKVRFIIFPSRRRACAHDILLQIFFFFFIATSKLQVLDTFT